MAILRFAVMEIQAPPRKRSALGDDHPAGPAVGHDDLGGDRMRFVLHVEHGVLAEADHPLIEQLGLAIDQHGTAGQIGVEPLDASIVEGQHVVLDGLDQPEALEFVSQLVGVISEMSWAWDQSVLVSYSSQTSSSRAGSLAPTSHGTL